MRRPLAAGARAVAHLDQLYRVSLGAAARLRPGCALSLEHGSLSEPYGVGLSCPVGGTAARLGRLPALPGHVAWLAIRPPAGRLAARSRSAGSGCRAPSPTTRSATGSSSPRPRPACRAARWLELAGGCAPGCSRRTAAARSASSTSTRFLRGAELHGIALSNPQPGLSRRAYLSVRVYDARRGGDRRPPATTSPGALPARPRGGAVRRTARPPRADRSTWASARPRCGCSRARAGKRDLVAMTATDDGVLAVYDDDAGALARVFSRDAVTGAPGGAPAVRAGRPGPRRRRGAALRQLLRASLRHPGGRAAGLARRGALVPSPADHPEAPRIGEVTP